MLLVREALAQPASHRRELVFLESLVGREPPFVGKGFQALLGAEALVHRADVAADRRQLAGIRGRRSERSDRRTRRA